MSTGGHLASTIEVLDGRVLAGDTMRYRLNNTGSVELICGLGYRLERKTAEGWILMNPGMAFRAIGFGVLPNESQEMKAAIPRQAPAGAYRISTSVNSDHVAERLWVSTEFDVVE